MKPKKLNRNHARFLSYFFAFMFLKVSWWIGAKFGSPTLEQIIFHVQNGTDGLADADPTIFHSFAIHVFLLPLVFATICFGVQQFVLSPRVSRFIDRYASSMSVHSTATRALAFFAKILQQSFEKYIPIGILLLGGVVIANKVALLSFLRNQEVSTFIDENYRAPKDQHLTAPKHKPNLVLIYVESLEQGYADSSVMGTDLLAPLNKPEKSAYHFDRFLQTTGTGWTIAGIVSTQCGVPLKSLSLFSIDNQKAKIKSFLPGIDCLGDVLDAHGYKNIFMGGASLYFADKGKFFAGHGYSELYGKEEWSRAGARNFSDWGLYDDELFARAKTRLDQLEKSSKPFNLTLLTVDTHIPKGYVSPTCAQRGVTEYRGIVTCTATLVADFVEYMKKRGYLKNTVVVILGDHLSMRAPLEAELDQMEQPRRIYNAIYAPSPLQKNRETIYHFGFFPSILYAMGFRFDANRLGLGASGFGERDQSKELPKLDYNTLNELLARSSGRYLEFWQAQEGDGTHAQQDKKN